ncbi:MAG: alpha/beta hydrolase-fold protein [Planctomycetota bacterium]
MPALRTLTCALTLALAASTCLAQGMPETDQERKDREFQLVFQEGLYALTKRDMQRAYQLFQQAVKLYPERPTAYYNLACAYSIDEDPETAVKYLRMAYERGFNDLAHMGRDMDLDAIRNTPAYRQVRAELEQAALLNVPPALSQVPAGEKLPLYVVIHGDTDTPSEVLQQVYQAAQAQGPAGVLVPQGPFEAENGGRAWRSQQEAGAGRMEFLVLRRLKEFLEETPSVDPQQVYLIGLGFSAYKAVSIAGHNPEAFTGVYAHGPLLGAEAGEIATKVRAYLVVDPQDAGQVASGVEARDAIYAAQGRAVLERWSGTPNAGLTAEDGPLQRGLAWLSGQAVKLPHAGEAVPF